MSHLLTPGVLQQAISGNFLYTVEYFSSTEYYIVKWDLRDGTIITKSLNVGSSLTALTCDKKHIYGFGGARRLRKYDLNTLEMVEEMPWFTNSTVTDMVNDGTYIYFSGSSTRIYKIRISDLTVVADINSYTNNAFLYLDGDNIFITGAGYVYKALKSDFSQLAVSPNYGYNLTMVFVHGDYVYYGGWTSQNLIKANKSDLSQAAISLNISRRPQCACVIGDYIYVGGTGWGIRRHLISDLIRDTSYSPFVTGSIHYILYNYQKNKQLVGGNNFNRPIILDAEGSVLLNNTSENQNYMISSAASKTIKMGTT